MANKVTSVSCVEVEDTNRFEPKMYLFQQALNHAQKTYNFVVLDKIATAINRGQSPKPETYKDKNNGKYVFIRTADVKKYQFNTESAVYLDDDTFATQKSNRIKKSDILISVVGNYLGSTSVIPNNIEIGAFNDNSARIRIVDNTISPYYVSAFFNSVFGQKLIQSLVTRTGQKILSAGNVKKLSLPIIDDVNVVSKYECATNNNVNANKLISQAQQLFYSRIGIDFKAIAKENTFSVCKSNFADADLWTPMYSYPLYVNTLKAIQGKWQTITIGEIATLKKGDEVGSDTYIGYLDKRKSDVPFVRTSDIVNYEIDQYPDFFIPKEIYDELGQGFQSGDVLFTKDGKIGMVGMITEYDKAIISSGFVGLRLNKKAQEYGVTPEYLFLALSIKEIGIYASKRRTVVASTIPHLREERLKEIEIPILDASTTAEITDLVKQSFKLKDEKKRLIAEVRETMDGYFEM
ncbi:MAG: restriction endonuclease subunit S [Paludibacteraceae bacterium]|nr:restriction endonuclease subunit S [Paludibacteraceae bacterium]